MSQAVRLSSKLAKDDETNGLDHLGAQLARDPHQVVAAIVWLTVSKITEDVDTDDRVPTVMIKRIEPIGVISKVPDEVVKLASDLYAARTGRTPLPFEVTEVIEGGYVNPNED